MLISSIDALGLAGDFERISPKLCEMCQQRRFVSTSTKPPRLEDHLLSAVVDCLFNNFRSSPPYLESVLPSET
jgi:hypothetical protein